VDEEEVDFIGINLQADLVGQCMLQLLFRNLSCALRIKLAESIHCIKLRTLTDKALPELFYLKFLLRNNREKVLDCRMSSFTSHVSSHWLGRFVKLWHEFVLLLTRGALI